MKTHQALVAFLAGSVLASPTWGATVTAAELSHLGQDLTEVGAEQAGNKDGTIPAFTGNEKPLPGWAYGKYREDYWTHKDDKPLFTIDASNVDKYADKLSPGQIAMLKQLPGYSMLIYPAHRDCGLPAAVTENTKQGATKSRIGTDGWSLADAVLPSVPFPIAKSGIEMVWNFIQRYQGVAAVVPRAYTALSASPGNTNHIWAQWTQITYFPWAKAGQHSPKDFDNLQNGIYYQFVEPASLAGQGLIQRYYFGKDTESWYYFTGQRRVRRLPAYAYDAPLVGFENQYPADQSYVFYGNPDRFDWKLVGKKEMYVPYDAYEMQRFNTKLPDVLGEKYSKPEFRHYELHRVWVVEATVKAGMRHATPKKVLYIDEDSYMAEVGDDYDGQGKIWRSKENWFAPQWEIQACGISAATYTDLVSGRYITDETVLGTGKDYQFLPPDSKDPRLQDSYYTGENLGAVSDR
jgi:hypothetical protein